jgi:hypothetical protein
MNYIRDTLEIDVDHATLYAWRTEVMKLYSHTTLETDVCFHVDDGLLRVPRFRWIRHAVAILSDTLEKENYQVSEGIRSRDIKLHVRFEGCRNAESRKDESKKDEDAWPHHTSDSAMREGFSHCEGVVKQALEQILTKA